MVYTIPKKLKEETKIFGKLLPIPIYLSDCISIAVFIFVSWGISGLVHTYLKIPFWIFAILCSLYLILPAGKVNPGKRKWESIYLFLISDNSVYRSIDPSMSKEENNDKTIPEER